MIEIKAEDGHSLNAYLALPQDKPKAAVIIVQEIFGVNPHIQSVCDDYAKQGFIAIAPAMFDRIERNVSLDYTADGVIKGRELKAAADVDLAMLDLTAAIENVAEHINDPLKISVVGYCWGGFLAWMAASRLNVDASVCYYGGGIAERINEQPNCPVMLHFGEQDTMIPISDVDIVREAHPNQTFYTYDADHGFNCDQRASYDASSATLARERTLTFLNKAFS